MVLLYSLLLLTFVTTANTACTFPSDLVGTWRSSRWDDLSFTTNEVSVPDLDDLGSPLVFECDTQSGTKYLIRSTTTVVILGNNVEVVACLDLVTGTTGVKYIYYHATAELDLPSGVTHPVLLVTPNTVITVSNTCTITSYATGTNDVMIKTNMIEDAVITCPNPLLANFDNYTVTTSTGVTACDGVGYIHVCDDSRTVNVEYGLCSEVIFYSDLGNLSCVYYSSSGSTFYVNLLNNEDTVDNTATYHYACVVIDYTTSPVYFSQWPRKCNSAQTATSVPSTVGYTFEAYTNVTCVPSSGGGFPIIIIIIIILLLIIAALMYYVCVKKKQWKKIKRKLPCAKDRKKKKGQVDPMNDVSSNSQAPLDGHRTGLQATAVTSGDRMSSMSLADRRNLETSQSTRSAITVSHMLTEFPDDTPRRLPPLEPIDPNQPPRKSDDSDTPSLLHRLPPIHESSTGLTDQNSSANHTQGGGDAPNVAPPDTHYD